MKKEKNKKINERSFYFQDYNYNSVEKNKNEKRKNIDFLQSAELCLINNLL